MDVSVRWSKYWNVYLYKSGEKDLSDKLEALYENEQLGPLLEGNDHWQIGKGEKESTYFECSLPTIDPEASGSLHEEIKLSQEHVPHDGLSKGEAGMDNSGDDMDLSVEVEELQMKKCKAVLLQGLGPQIAVLDQLLGTNG
ncbi:predicted protein [Phaeodactylum tricornutum CCAP 1055/1]|uniref:Uncharacterized protein n=1 Tax=Phaeodactylum tricornutum (strain CCAP 1055/1) TaxID=556484 RepID=B7FRM4_PHATC|nr:predicted protein [Phaeodactylum tricornutum CCAP 1055/1]EEC51536.1 predicted protein [Phaeodactylum tricornutum CCAP 1055/1]|eukprot:XP_002177073.1 predicted protein [Phaeodactylum tricornutum CCAP 1055/1]